MSLLIPACFSIVFTILSYVPDIYRYTQTKSWKHISLFPYTMALGNAAIGIYVVYIAKQDNSLLFYFVFSVVFILSIPAMLMNLIERCYDRLDGELPIVPSYV